MFESQNPLFSNFYWRKAHPIERKINENLHAGSLMYYYCHTCGHLAETRPETWYLDPPKLYCDECAILIDLNFLDAFGAILTKPL